MIGFSNIRIEKSVRCPNLRAKCKSKFLTDRVCYLVTNYISVLYNLIHVLISSKSTSVNKAGAWCSDTDVSHNTVANKTGDRCYRCIYTCVWLTRHGERTLGRTYESVVNTGGSVGWLREGTEGQHGRRR